MWIELANYKKKKEKAARYFLFITISLLFQGYKNLNGA